MTISHAFGIRFRASHEDEGQGTLLVTCDSTDQLLTVSIRRAVETVVHEHPSVQFDGMIYYGSHEYS